MIFRLFFYGVMVTVLWDGWSCHFSVHIGTQATFFCYYCFYHITSKYIQVSEEQANQ